MFIGCGDVTSKQPHNDADPDGSGAPIAYRKAIEIQGSKVTGSNIDFPVWIELVDSDLTAHARPDGRDVFFTDAAGLALDYEIESWTPATHTLLAWVRVPTLVGPTNTTIYVEYGDVAKVTSPNPAGVFRSSFAAVWHLDDTLSSATIVDATGTHPGTVSGLAPAAQMTAQLGGGIAFDGSGTGSISFTNPLVGGNPHTISAWVLQQTTTHTSAVVVMGSPSTDEARFLYSFAGTASTSNPTSIGAGQYSDDWTPANESIVGAGWTLLVWTSEGSSKNNHIYKNGAEITGSPTATTAIANTTGTSGLIGVAPMPAFGTSTGMAGTLDELRIATVARSPGWIATEWANQSMPLTFYAVGPEQVAP